jgi:hypothetical protein
MRQDARWMPLLAATSTSRPTALCAARGLLKTLWLSLWFGHHQLEDQVAYAHWHNAGI